MHPSTVSTRPFPHRLNQPTSPSMTSVSARIAHQTKIQGAVQCFRDAGEAPRATDYRAFQDALSGYGQEHVWVAALVPEVRRIPGVFGRSIITGCFDAAEAAIHLRRLKLESCATPLLERIQELTDVSSHAAVCAVGMAQTPYGDVCLRLLEAVAAVAPHAVATIVSLPTLRVLYPATTASPVQLSALLGLCTHLVPGSGVATLQLFRSMVLSVWNTPDLGVFHTAVQLLDRVVTYGDLDDDSEAHVVAHACVAALDSRGLCAPDSQTVTTLGMVVRVLTTMLLLGSPGCPTAIRDILLLSPRAVLTLQGLRHFPGTASRVEDLLLVGGGLFSATDVGSALSSVGLCPVPPAPECTCPLCLDAMDGSGSGTVMLPCAHTMHADCAAVLLRRGALTCPECRLDIVSGCCAFHLLSPAALGVGVR